MFYYEAENVFRDRFLAQISNWINNFLSCMECTHCQYNGIKANHLNEIIEFLVMLSISVLRSLILHTRYTAVQVMSR